ncbi:hypothetical protein C1X89_28100 [Pseudomonas sp. GP01-A8]|nr:hypothetical protein C1X89_28100 [Pseudomonas sp. GP01-A8]PMU59620.1 hypothetical protein C1X86_27805 [Pseudomonas sp. GP01-A3]PMU67473.1 hypothetical protein C1X81_27680 [Pseudomonas sp. FW215-L2]PMU67858.1 hypothetical protein C1X84_29335 [Pseudomonas sp. GP01-A1]PMU83873.1 hypothetical protein C1X91_07905 [Pseudomonas sp. GP01-A5]PMV02351.1 hypothetical protein C1X82_29255 [Pseudomonas sp. GP01-A11]PMX61136.1 hypothetical protein C1X92_28945 [Pseudomonas sp. GP01-A15]
MGTVNVGAGLLAKAVCQSPSSLTDPPSSRASPLPHSVLTRLDYSATGALSSSLSFQGEPHHE